MNTVYFHTSKFGDITEPVLIGGTFLGSPRVEKEMAEKFGIKDRVIISGQLRPEFLSRKTFILYPVRIIRNGKATVIFWEDHTKTVVRLAKNDIDSFKIAIIWALAKKEFGTMSQVHHYLDKLEQKLSIDSVSALFMYFLGVKFGGNIDLFWNYLVFFEKILDKNEA